MGRIYQRIFAAVYDKVMHGTEQHLAVNRTRLVSSLKGSILDVGFGTGANFPFFDKEASIIAIEPSMPMMKKAQLKFGDLPNVRMYNYGVNDDKVDVLIEEQSLDAIVCTLVLCTINDPERALRRFNKWLKPNGRLVIMEHIKSKHPVKGRLQELFNPAWKVIGDGCNLTRHTDHLIESLGFLPEEKQYFTRTISFVEGVYRKPFLPEE